MDHCIEGGYGGEVDGDDGGDDGSPGNVLAPSEERGREPPPSSSSLDPPGWGKGLPTVFGGHGYGGRDPPPILYLTFRGVVSESCFMSPDTILSFPRNPLLRKI